MDQERPFWRAVVYLNIIKAVRTILNDLDYEFTALEEDFSQTVQRMSQHTSSLVADFESLRDIWDAEFGPIRNKLLPLMVLEETLAIELSDGVSVVRGRAGVSIRSGWQGLFNKRSTVSGSGNRPNNGVTQAETVNLVARTLGMFVESIKALWGHCIVRRLMHWRRLRLDESAAL